MSKGSTEIGYLCHHGHYCFHADPDEAGQCGTKRVGTVTLTFDDTDAPTDWTEIVSAAQASLAEKYETWRTCRCEKPWGESAGVEELIKRSSLGTPEAKALRDSVSDEAVAKVMARVKELEEGHCEGHGGPGRWYCCQHPDAGWPCNGTAEADA